MKKMKKFLTALFSVFTLGIILFSCSNNDENTSRIAIRLTDAPGDFEAVNIDVQDILINRGNEDVESGWESILTEGVAGLYN